LQIFIARVERDDQAISELLDECLEFLGELEKLETEIKTKMEQQS